MITNLTILGHRHGATEKRRRGGRPLRDFVVDGWIARGEQGADLEAMVKSHGKMVRNHQETGISYGILKGFSERTCPMVI